MPPPGPASSTTSRLVEAWICVALLPISTRTLSLLSLWIFLQIPAPNSEITRFKFFTWILEAWKPLWIPLTIVQGRYAKFRFYSGLLTERTLMLSHSARRGLILLFQTEKFFLAITFFARTETAVEEGFWLLFRVLLTLLDVSTWKG